MYRFSSDHWETVEEAAAEEVPAVELASPPLQAAMVKAMARAIIPAITFFILSLSFSLHLVAAQVKSATCAVPYNGIEFTPDLLQNRPVFFYSFLTSSGENMNFCYDPAEIHKRNFQCEIEFCIERRSPPGPLSLNVKFNPGNSR